MSKRFGRNQKRRLRQELKLHQELSGSTIRNLKHDVARLRKENHNLSFRQERLDQSEFDIEASLVNVCRSVEARRTALNMRKFVLDRSIDRISIHQGTIDYVQHLKRSLEHELCSYLVKHVKIKEEVNPDTGDLVVYASIIAESLTSGNPAAATSTRS